MDKQFKAKYIALLTAKKVTKKRSKNSIQSKVIAEASESDEESVASSQRHSKTKGIKKQYFGFKFAREAQLEVIMKE